jgi:hypothetical protein
MDNAVLGADAARPGEDAPRELAIARPEDPALVHLAVVGDTYTVLFSGEQTAGRFAMLDMLIPPGGGPRRIVTISRSASGSSRARWRCMCAISRRFGWRWGSQPTSRPTPRIPSATRRRFQRDCSVPSHLPASRSTSPSSAIPSRPAPPRPRNSATPSARSGCGEPSRGRRSTAWRSCLCPRTELVTSAGSGEALLSGRGRAQMVAHRCFLEASSNSNESEAPNEGSSFPRVRRPRCPPL